jgi:hypothetical protein
LAQSRPNFRYLSSGEYALEAMVVLLFWCRIFLCAGTSWTIATTLTIITADLAM